MKTTCKMTGAGTIKTSVLQRTAAPKQINHPTTMVMIIRYLLMVLAGMAVMLCSSTATAATRYSVATGNWGATSTWSATSGGASGASAPVAGDDAIIEGGFTVTVAANAAAATVSIASGSTLSVGGFNITISGTTTVNGTLNITGTAGTKTFTGDVTINSGGIWNNTANEGVSFGGSLQNDGTFTAGTAVQTFTGAANTIGGANLISIPSLTVSGTYQNSGTLTVNTALAGAGTLTQGASATLNLGVASVSPTLVATASPNTVNYTFAGAQTIKAASYHHLTTSGSGTKTLGGAIVVNGDLTISSGTTLDASTSNYAISVGGNWSNSGAFTQRSGTVSLNGSSAQSIGGSTATTFYGLNINNGAGASIATTPTVSSALTLTAGQLDNSVNNVTLAAGATIYRATGSLAASPTFGTTVNVNYSGTSGVTTGPEIPTSTTVLSGLTINNSGGVALGASLTVNGALSLTTGALSIGANTLTLNSTIATTGGTLAGGPSANIIFNGSGATTLPTVSLGNLTVNRSAVAITLGGLVTVDGTLTLTAGALSIGANTLTLNGAVSTAAGTLTGSTSSDIVVGGSGASTTLPAVASGLRNLTLDRANGLTLGGAVTVNSTLTLTVGQLSNGVNLALASGATISREAGALATAPTFTTTVNVTYAGSSPVTTGFEIPTASTILQTLNVNNSGGVTLGANVTSKGVLTVGSGATLDASSRTITLTAVGTPLVVTGTFTPSTSTVAYTSTTGASVTGGINYYNLSVNGNGTTDTFTALDNLSVANELTIGSLATFNANGKVITLSGSGTPLVATGILSGGGNTASTIAYTSASGATVAGVTYTNLTVNGTGTFALGGTATVNGTLALTSGDLSIGVNTLTLNGAVSTTSGTLTGGATSSVIFGGSGASTALPPVSLNNLTVNRANGISLGGAVSVAGTLTLTSGQVGSANNLTIGSGAAISRAVGSLDSGVPAFSGTVNVTYTSGGVTTGTELPASTGNVLQALSFNNASGTVTLGGAATVNGTLTIATGGTLADGGYTLTAKSTVSNSGTHSSTGSGNILFAGSGSAQTVAGTFGNVELNNAAGTTCGALTVNGNLKVAAGTFSIPGITMSVSGLTTVDSILAITGTAGGKTFGGITISGTGAWSNSINETVSIKGNFQCDGSFVAGTAAYTFDGTGSQDIGGTATPAFALLTLNNTAAPITASANFNVSGTFSISAAGVEFIPAAGVVINSAATQGILNGSGAIKVTRTAATADLFNQYRFNTRTLTSMTVDYAGGGDQTINVPSTSYGALTISGSGAKTLAGDMSVSGALTLTSGALSIGASTLTLNAAISTTGGTLTGGPGSSINFATAAGGATTLPAVSGGLLNLTVNRTAGLALGGAVSVGGTLTLTGGTVSGAGNLTLGDGATVSRVSGSLSGTPAFAGMVNLIYTATATTGTEMPASPTVLNNLTVSGGTTTLGAAVTASGNVTLGGTLNTSASGYSLTVAGNLAVGTGSLVANSSTITVGGNFSGTGTFTAGTSTFILNGSGSQTIPTTASFGNFNNLVVNKPGGVATLAGVITVGGGITLTQGELDASAGNYGISVGGDWVLSSGTFTPRSGAVTFNGAGAQAINGSTSSLTFYDVTLAKTAGTTLSVGGSTTSLTVNNLTETTGNFTAPATLDINGILTLSAGTFTAGTSITIAGNWTQATAASFVPGSGTVTFDGAAAQAIGGTAAALTFNNLTVNDSSGVALSSVLTNNGILNMVSGIMLGAGSVVIPATGTLKGGTAVYVPVTLNGTVAPGGSVGRLASNREVWNGGATNQWELQDAAGSPGSGWDLLTISNRHGINLSATTNNPFIFKLVSLNAGAPGAAANFDNNNSYTWTAVIATNAGVTNFDAAKFAFDSSAFVNDLAGGVFGVTAAKVGGDTNLNVTFAPNHSPAATEAQYGYPKGVAIKSLVIPIASFLTNHTSDVDSDNRGLVEAACATSTVTTDANNITIRVPHGNEEYIRYVARDLRSSYRAGDTVRMATNYIHIVRTNTTGVVNISNTGGTNMTAKFFGIPGYTYVLQRSCFDLSSWVDVYTNTASSIGLFEYTETPSCNPAFYRVRTE